MKKKYNIRKNFSGVASDKKNSIEGKLAFKTKETNWIGTADPVVLLISIHSAFHEGVEGKLKMKAFTSIIKRHVKGKITVLMADKAHLRTMSLFHDGNSQRVLNDIVREAQLLTSRFRACFEKCSVVSWNSYICNDADYLFFLKKIHILSHTDKSFQAFLIEDAESTYTEARRVEFPNKSLFIEKTIEDIKEQCACLLVLANKGYRFQFYPGPQFKSVEYVNRNLCPLNQQLSLVHVFLAIEKKRIKKRIGERL